MSTFVPIWGRCEACKHKITWMFGGWFWLHAQEYANDPEAPRDHVAPNPAPPGYQLRPDL